MCTTLIVEDGAVFRRALKNVLHQRFPSMYLAEARNGEQALEIIDSLQPDIIILDLILSQGIGLPVTKRLKRQLPNAVILALVDCDLPECRQAAFASGADDILPKSACSAGDIVAAVERALKAKPFT